MNDGAFLFYQSWYSIIVEEYPNKSDQDILIRALVQYGTTGEKTYPMEKMFLKQAYCQIDSAKKKWDEIRQVRSEAGKKGGLKGKGGAPKGNKNASKQKQTIANNSKQNHNVNDNVNVNVNVNDNVNDNNNTVHSDMPIEGQSSVLTDERVVDGHPDVYIDEDGCMYSSDPMELYKVWLEEQARDGTSD